jgi:hypothetical protein
MKGTIGGSVGTAQILYILRDLRSCTSSALPEGTFSESLSRVLILIVPLTNHSLHDRDPSATTSSGTSVPVNLTLSYSGPTNTRVSKPDATLLCDRSAFPYKNVDQFQALPPVSEAQSLFSACAMQRTIVSFSELFPIVSARFAISSSP